MKKIIGLVASVLMVAAVFAQSAGQHIILVKVAGSHKEARQKLQSVFAHDLKGQLRTGEFVVINADAISAAKQKVAAVPGATVREISGAELTKLGGDKFKTR